MTEKAVTLFLCIFFLAVTPRAQTMVVDMDTASDIQDSFSTQDTVGTVVIPLRITDADNLFSYQFKVAFDTGRFTFVGAQQDFGMLGEKNILAKNGGTLIGIFELQVNPPASDTVEFSCTITGSDKSKSVSGDGLIGVLYLQSKMHSDDSTEITISQGFLAEFGGSLEPVSSYTQGMFITKPFMHVRHSTRSPLRGRRIVVDCRTSSVNFFIPRNYCAFGGAISITLHSLDGRLILQRSFLLEADGDRFTIPTPAITTLSGTFICTLRLGGLHLSQTIGFP